MTNIALKALACAFFTFFASNAMAATAQSAQSLTPEKVASLWEKKRQAAPEKYEQEFEGARRSVFDMLPALRRTVRQNPFFTLGALRVKDMLTSFLKVRVYSNFVSGKAPSLNEATDYEWPQYKMAVLNTPFVDVEPQRRQLILLHVFLTAAGYEDSDYQLTLAVMIAEIKYRNPQNQSLADLNIGLLFPQHRFLLHAKSSQTDDSTGAAVKLELVKVAAQAATFASKAGLGCRRAWSDPTTYVEDIQSLRIDGAPDTASESFFLKRGDKYYTATHLQLLFDSLNYPNEETPARQAVFGMLKDFCTTKYGVR